MSVFFVPVFQSANANVFKLAASPLWIYCKGQAIWMQMQYFVFVRRFCELILVWNSPNHTCEYTALFGVYFIYVLEQPLHVQTFASNFIFGEVWLRGLKWLVFYVRFAAEKTHKAVEGHRIPYTPPGAFRPPSCIPPTYSWGLLN